MSILVSRDETDIDTSQINVVVFCLNPLASRVSVLNWCRVSFSTDVGQGESILTENFGKTCCIWSANSQNGAKCGAYVDFYEDVIWGMGCKNCLNCMF